MIELNGKKLSEIRLMALKKRVQEFKSKYGRPPGIAVVLVGEDPASQVYVGHKVKKAEASGLHSVVHRLEASSSRDQLKDLITVINKDSSVDGLLVQLPLPKHLDSDEVLSWILPKKDADALTIENIGLFMSGQPRVLSCTPAGVMELLKYYNVPIEGKKALVVGRSKIVGQPMAQLLLNANATVTVAHSKTVNLKAELKASDIVVVAAGRPEFLGAEDFKKGAVVVDVGIHRQSGKLVGDVNPKGLSEHLSGFTPVPGGVGPMTITMLLENIVTLAEQGMQL